MPQLQPYSSVMVRNDPILDLKSFLRGFEMACTGFWITFIQETTQMFDLFLRFGQVVTYNIYSIHPSLNRLSVGQNWALLLFFQCSIFVLPMVPFVIYIDEVKALVENTRISTGHNVNGERGFIIKDITHVVKSIMRLLKAKWSFIVWH